MGYLKVASEPTDSSAPSFLQLPAEIRNFIYGYLFERDGLTRLHSADAFFPRKPDPKDYEEEGLGISCRCPSCYSGDSPYYRDLTSWEQAMADDEDEMKHFKNHLSHSFSDGLGILMSCRQIHHEAGGVLYGHNTFAFTRSTFRHDRHNDTNGRDEWQENPRSRQKFYDDEAYSQINYAAHWLGSIGDHFPFLRKIIIDTDTMCPSECPWVTDYDILPLLRILWARPDTKCQIVFSSAGMPISSDVHHGPYEESKWCLNAVLDTIGKQDVLSLRRVTKSLEKIVLSRKAWFPNSYVSYKRGMFRCFRISNNGAKFAWTPRQRACTLRCLPRSIKGIICRYTALAPEGITFDLTSLETYGLNHGLFSIFDVIQPNYPLTLAMTSHTVATDFDNFVKLNHLLWPSILGKSVIKRIAKGNYGRTCGQSINLNFMLDQSKYHEHIRINVRGLVRLLSSTSFLQSNTWSNISINLKDERGVHRSKIAVPIKDLRKAVFLFLTDLLRKEAGHPTSLLDTPDIWINGYGEIVGYIDDSENYWCTGATGWEFDLINHGRRVSGRSQELRLAWVAHKIRWRTEMLDGDCWIEQRDHCILHAWDGLRRCVEVEWGVLDNATYQPDYGLKWDWWR